MREYFPERNIFDGSLLTSTIGKKSGGASWIIHSLIMKKNRIKSEMKKRKKVSFDF